MSRVRVRAVERVGTYAKAHPIAAGASALGSAVALALVMVGVSHVVTGPSAARPTAARFTAAATTPTGSAAPSTAALSRESTAVKLASTPPTPPTLEQRGPAAPTVAPTTASGHLVAGRYVEARAAYHELAAAQPANPAYLAMTRLLEKRTSSICSGADAAPTCPEILP